MKTKPDDFEGVNDPFAAQPTSRLVWIVPSVLAHLAVLAIWLSLPEKEPRSLEDRKLVIRSEQAEQLKEHVEDSNLRELHAEVQRLQAIKRSMAAIRSEAIVTLDEFEEEMRASLKVDAGQVLTELLDCQGQFANAQTQVLERMVRIDGIFNTIQPLLEKRDFVQIVSHVSQLLEIRNELKGKQEQLDKDFLLLMAKLDSADSVLGWTKDPEVANRWKTYVLLQEKALQLQSTCSDEQGQLHVRQTGALNRIASEGTAHAARVQQLLATEEQAQAKYEKAQAQLVELESASADAETDRQQKLAEVDTKVAKLKADRDRLREQYKKVGTKSEDDKQRRRDLQMKQKDMDRQIMITSRTKKTIQDQFRNASRHRANQRTTLKRLKPASQNSKNQRKKIIETMGRSLDNLAARAGNIPAQQDALQLQQQALQQSKSLIEVVQQQMGGTN